VCKFKQVRLLLLALLRLDVRWSELAGLYSMLAEPLQAKPIEKSEATKRASRKGSHGWVTKR